MTASRIRLALILAVNGLGLVVVNRMDSGVPLAVVVVGLILLTGILGAFGASARR